MGLKTKAYLSPCRKHRYTLERIWDDSLPTLAVIGLNPSTADETEDDPTIRRVIAFAKRDGFGSILMMNLFSWRSTDPKVLKTMDTYALTNNLLNTRTVKEHCAKVVASGGQIACAWGKDGSIHGYGDFFGIHLGSYCLKCWGKNKDGSPCHPLYLKGDTPLVQW